MKIEHIILVIILFCMFHGGCLFPAEEIAQVEITTIYRDLDGDGCYDAFEVLVSFKKEDGSPCHYWNVSSNIVVRIHPTSKAGTDSSEGEPIYGGVTFFEDSDDASFLIHFEYVDLDFSSYESDRFIAYYYVEVGDQTFSHREVILWSGLCKQLQLHTQLLALGL